MQVLKLLLKLTLVLAVLAGAFLLQQLEVQDDFDFTDSFSKGPDLTPGILQFILFIPMIICAGVFFLHLKGSLISKPDSNIRWGAFGLILFAHFISIQSSVWNWVFNPVFLVLNGPADGVQFITVTLACFFSATTFVALFSFFKPQEKTLPS